MSMTKRLYEKYYQEYLAKYSQSSPLDEDQIQEYIQMRIEEWWDRWKYEDGDHSYTPGI